MITLNYNCKNNLHFVNEQSFCTVLGVLANNKYTKIVWEHNEKQGAWGSEGRIHIYKDNTYLTKFLQPWFTKGRDNFSPPILCREQGNGYIKYLNQKFRIGNNISQDGDYIRQIVETQYPQYLQDFDTGYNS